MAGTSASPHDQALETHAPAWLDRAVLGIFIHWGAYSVPAWAEPHGELGTEPDETQWFTHNAYAEWYFNTIRIQGSPAQAHHRATYGSLPYDAFLDMWRAEHFDPDDWADLFRRAGADLVIPTTKHHDGIALWDAPGTFGRNTVERGPRRDLVGDIARAVRRRGLHFGVYYSGGLDWHYRPFPPVLCQEDLDRFARTVDPEYARYIYVHCMDLFERYHPEVFWNDIDWPDCAKSFEENSLGMLLRNYYSLCPQGAVNDRFGGFHCDYETSEYQAMQESEGAERWENCRGIGLSFGYNRQETGEQYLSGAGLSAHLADVVARGGRLLLNVGPRADGTIPETQRDSLEGLGQWMSVAKAELVGATQELRDRACSIEGARLISHEDHAVLLSLEAVDVAVDDLPEAFDWRRARALDSLDAVGLSVGEGRLRSAPGRLGPAVIVAPRRR